MKMIFALVLAFSFHGVASAANSIERTCTDDAFCEEGGTFLRFRESGLSCSPRQVSSRRLENIHDNRLQLEAQFNDDHKFYVSVSNITFSEKDQALRMVSRFFIDDLQLLMKQRYDTEIELTTEADQKPVINLLQRYLSSKTELYVNREEKTLDVLGYEYDVDQIVVYTEIPDVKQVNRLSLRFEVLFDMFSEQKNMVHIDYAGEKRTMLLLLDRPRETFVYPLKN